MTEMNEGQPPILMAGDVADGKITEFSPVDCNNCPYNLSCVGRAKNPYPRAGCCKCAAFDIYDGYGYVLIDCTKSTFNAPAPDTDTGVPCVMCSGDIVSLRRPYTREYYWLPTVHAKVSAEDRAKLWRARGAIRKRQEEERAIRKKELRDTWMGSPRKEMP